MNISDIPQIDINVSALRYCDEAILRIDYNMYIIINVILSLILFLNVKTGYFGKIMKLLGIEGYDDTYFNKSMAMYILFYNVFLFAIQFFLEPVTYVVKGLS